jgi:hypothetical protein
MRQQNNKITEVQIMIRCAIYVIQSQRKKENQAKE